MASRSLSGVGLASISWPLRALTCYLGLRLHAKKLLYFLLVPYALRLGHRVPAARHLHAD